MNAGLIVLLAIFASAYAASVKSNGMECMMCTLAVGYAEDYLKDNEAQEEQTIEEYMCNKMPKMFIAMCDNLVESYLPQIIDGLERQQPPKVVCQEIKMC
uniref:Saposin B-type domain-containing protein n=1 Tax=Plectus sambesii TaxID=2011161 RepID=A0A914V7D3_9BILA